jgi:hypothetical protein
VHIKEPQDLRSGAVQKVEVYTKQPKDFKGGGQEEKEP